MQNLILIIAAGFFIVSCSSNPHKAEKIETNIDKAEGVGADQQLGVKDGNMVVQRKVIMSEEVRKLQYDVYELEDRVYGNRKYGSLGLYGVLKKCKVELSDKKNGGDGKLIWTEPIDRVTDRDEDYKIGLDERDKLVGVSEEFLKDRITKFRNYRNILEKRQDEYEEKLAVCQVDLRGRKADQEKK
jgi:hypothetical protein